MVRTYLIVAADQAGALDTVAREELFGWIEDIHISGGSHDRGSV